MSKNKIQLYYDSSKDIEVANLIANFEKEGAGTRGYTTDKVKECLKVYQLLAEKCGTQAPMQFLMYYASGLGASSLSGTEETSASIESDVLDNAEESEVPEEVSEDVADLIGDGMDFGL
ncbi:hypothetical protein [Priestia taiwanensis]|uniref:Uncharacterized protein n=1 Tax=Priestia taiwanensis TaxID=1347902 RepID=A0A917ARG6_9BACI|nr:hypothetical protein [Priestia taiwanensis]MBM7362738.1 hypothetical protein [Priestia taiwanensis]GGE64667.1 hypothetical protein GCM10007140_13620 [Priestia taiwanensis]